jgi:hypothetical protein
VQAFTYALDVYIDYFRSSCWRASRIICSLGSSRTPAGTRRMSHSELIINNPKLNLHSLILFVVRQKLRMYIEKHVRKNLKHRTEPVSQCSTIVRRVCRYV